VYRYALQRAVEQASEGELGDAYPALLGERLRDPVLRASVLNVVQDYENPPETPAPAPASARAMALPYRVRRR
jgi:hypothetical protein